MRISLIVLALLLPLIVASQTSKKPYGVTLITAPSGSQVAPVPDESAVQYKFDFTAAKDQMHFLLELKEYRKGEYVSDLLGDDILKGPVGKGSPVKFRQFLDFSNPKRFCVYTYTGASMWLKSRACERPLKYVEYQTGNMGEAGIHPLFLVYEDDDKGTVGKMLEKLLIGGKLPARYTPDALDAKRIPHLMFIYYQLQ